MRVHQRTYRWPTLHLMRNTILKDSLHNRHQMAVQREIGELIFCSRLLRGNAQRRTCAVDIDADPAISKCSRKAQARRRARSRLRCSRRTR